MSFSLPEKILALDGRLTGAKISHAFGGALALAYYAEPRATIDIDVNLFIPIKRYGFLRETIDSLGVAGEVDKKTLESQGQCRLLWDRTPIDLFFAYDDLHWEMRRKLRLVPFSTDSKIPILSPEHLMVCKVAYNRPKDWIDIEQMLAFVEPLDYDEIITWLTRILGKDDSRVKKLDRLRDRLLR